MSVFFIEECKEFCSTRLNTNIQSVAKMSEPTKKHFYLINKKQQTTSTVQFLQEETRIPFDIFFDARIPFNLPSTSNLSVSKFDFPGLLLLGRYVVSLCSSIVRGKSIFAAFWSNSAHEKEYFASDSCHFLLPSFVEHMFTSI